MLLLVMINEHLISIFHQYFPVGIISPIPTYFCTLLCQGCTFTNMLDMVGTNPSTWGHASRGQS